MFLVEIIKKHPLSLAPVGLSVAYALGVMFKGRSLRDYSIQSRMMLSIAFRLLRHLVGTRALTLSMALVLLYSLRRVLQSQQHLTLQYVKSRIILFLMRQPSFKPETVRSIFMDLPDSVFRVGSNHTHPESAGNRNSSITFMDRLAGMLGCTAYHVQRSRADERNGRDGSRALYWTKDLTATPTHLSLPPNPLLAFGDVDQYIDMPSLLCDNVYPTCIYTFQPDQVSKVAKDYSYTFDALDGVTYNVAGGGRFQHQVWNYGSDHFLVTKTFLGIPYKTAAYLCDRRSTSPDHELIMLTPLGSWSLVGSLVYNEWIYGRRLQRLKVATPSGFLRLTSLTTEGIFVSTGRPDSYVSARVPVKTDDTISTIARTSQYPLAMPQVMSYVDGDRPTAACLLEYHKKLNADKPDVVCPLPLAVRSYQFHPNTYMPGMPPAMKPFMSPLLHGAFVPTVCKQNEEECIRARVLEVKPGILLMTPFLTRLMKEFAQLFIPDSIKHTLDPVDHDEVTERQNRPAQRRLAAQNEATLAKRVVNMFMKKESYGNVKPPRPISIINPVDKREYSRYIYAFEQILKVQPWYAFGKEPKLIAQRVAEVLAQAQTGSNTDFHRFDGHGSNVMRELETILLMRAFRLCYHAELSELHKSQFGREAFGMFQSYYETEFSRLSGSPETSCFNSIINAFVNYASLRMTKRQGLFVQPLEAWAGLGIYGGDDGLTADVDPESSAKAAAMIGQELAIQVVKRGELGIKFLSRVYSPDIWSGDVNSCCDIPRQLAKIHVTVNMGKDVTPAMKLLEKVRSFMLTDEHTPIIGEYCAAVAKTQYGDIKANDKTLPMRSYWSRFTKENQYINHSADWMIAYCESVLPEFQYKRFRQWVASACNIDNLMSPPMFMEPVAAKSDIPVVIDDRVIPEGKVYDPEPLPLRPSKEERMARKDMKISADPPVMSEFGIPMLQSRSTENSQALLASTEPLETERKMKIFVAHDAPVVALKETFKQMKLRKQLAGTWQDENPNGAKKLVNESKFREILVSNALLNGVAPPLAATVSQPVVQPSTKAKVVKAARARKAWVARKR